MQVIKTGIAGTMESSDILITVNPNKDDGIKIELTSSVSKQFGKQIVKVITECAQKLEVKDAHIIALDKGALDCVIKARVETALYRAANSTEYVWESK